MRIQIPVHQIPTPELVDSQVHFLHEFDVYVLAHLHQLIHAGAEQFPFHVLLDRLQVLLVFLRFEEFDEVGVVQDRVIQDVPGVLVLVLGHCLQQELQVALQGDYWGESAVGTVHFEAFAVAVGQVVRVVVPDV